jgi:hypothetical protein
MAITTDSEWRTCNDPIALIERLDGTITNGERLLILTAYTRPIWTHGPMMNCGVGLAMDRLELAAYGELEAEVFDGSAEVVQAVVDDMGAEFVRHAPEGMSAHLCHEAAQWAVRRIGFIETVERLADLLRRIILYRPAPPPGYQMQPHEIPWPIFVHLEGGIDGRPSIWNQTLTNCRRLMADTIREVMPSPYSQIAVEPSWLDEDTVHSAFVMHQTGNFEAIEQLGEQLELRGCGDSEILLHCIAPRHHRGCWLIDEITAMRHRLRAINP